MNPENAWEQAIDELDDPLSSAASDCQVVGYHDWTFTVLAPNKTTARIVDNPTMKTKIMAAMDLAYLKDKDFQFIVQLAESSEEDSVSEAWNHVLTQIQMEMPRAAFDTWVRDTWVKDLTSDILNIAVRNSYSCDWLENRIQKSASRLASEKLGQHVQVRFVVASREVLEDDKPEEEPEENNITDITPVDNTAYEAEVNTSLIVGFPGYALRLLRQGDLTAKEMTLWMAFRQSTYHLWSRGKKPVKNIPYWDVLRFANMSRPSFSREVANRDKFAGGMVEVVGEDLGALANDARFDNAKRYRVQTTPRLTRRDCAAIEAALKKTVCEAGTIPEAVEIATKTLRELAAQHPSEFLDKPNIQDTNHWFRGVVEIVRRVIGLKGDMSDELYKAAENLQNHIIHAYGTVVITHYFLQQVAPHLKLSQGQMWAIIALRDSCWYDYTSKAPIPLAVLPGGIDELAEMCGATAKSVRNWLNDPAFQAFAEIVDTEGEELPESWGPRHVVFSVRLTEPTQDDWEKMIHAQRKNDSGSGKEPPAAREKVIHGSEKVIHAQGKSDTGVGKKRYTPREKMIHGLGKNDTPLKSLIKPLLNPYKPLESPQTLRRQNSARKPGVGSQVFWEWDDLMSKSSVGLAMSKKLLAANKESGNNIARLSCNFVSWILYAYSESGRGVNQPVSNTLARLRENIYSGAGGDFDRLAALSPRELKVMLDADLAGKEIPAQYAYLYEHNFASTPDNYKRELREKLFD